MKLRDTKPLSTSPRSVAALSSAFGRRRRAKARREGLVLIAEDDDTTRLVLQDALARLGYNAIPVDSGTGIFPILEREEVNAILLDLNMPGMNGWEVLRKLREDFSLRERRFHLSVIILSGQSDRASREFALSLGADAFLAKPLDLEAVARAMAAIPLR